MAIIIKREKHVRKKISRFLKFIFRLFNKALYLVGLGIFLILITTFLLGFIGGWFSKKSSLQSFPAISDKERILILAPHPDDETLGAAGLIQNALAMNAKVKVVVATNGDYNEGVLLRESLKKDISASNIRFSPQSFVDFGVRRQQESKDSMIILGLNQNDLIFLGYPDSGLTAMFSENYKVPFTAPGTRFTFSPYADTYRRNTEYKGENLDLDLKEIINNFKPTAIFVTHVRDAHPDHHALALFLNKALGELKYQTQVYYYLIHYKDFPQPPDKVENQLIYPPNKLFSYEGWYSLSLAQPEEKKKDSALSSYKSEIVQFLTKDKMFSFVRRNEIFELVR